MTRRPTPPIPHPHNTIPLQTKKNNYRIILIDVSKDPFVLAIEDGKTAKEDAESVPLNRLVPVLLQDGNPKIDHGESFIKFRRMFINPTSHTKSSSSASDSPPLEPPSSGQPSLRAHNLRHLARVVLTIFLFNLSWMFTLYLGLFFTSQSKT